MIGAASDPWARHPPPLRQRPGCRREAVFCIQTQGSFGLTQG